MSETGARVFVGRDAELTRFRQLLDDPTGRAVLIIGQEGMGKTVLAQQMGEAAELHPTLQCTAIRYEVTRTDPVGAVMEMILDDSVRVLEKSFFGGSSSNRRQLEKLGKLLTLLPGGREVGVILQVLTTLRDEVKRPIRSRFLSALEAISKGMGETQRALFIIDPEKYLQPDSADAWRLVVRDLPDRVILLFPQRPEDTLAMSRDFRSLAKVECIPEQPLKRLKDKAVEQLLHAGGCPEHKAVFDRFNGHPYATHAALNLVIAGTPIEDLPQDPTPTKIAEAQWRRVRQTSSKAIDYFQALAILEVPVAAGIAEKVAGISSTESSEIRANDFLKGLHLESDGLQKIYHGLLSDHIRDHLDAGRARNLHKRAAALYRELLNQERPDVFAARRLPEHCLKLGGKDAFIDAVAYKTVHPLRDQGFFEDALALILRAERLAPEPKQRGNLLTSKALIYKTRGELDQAEVMLRKALEISEKTGSLDVKAAVYGNLGLLYQTRGELDQAKDMLGEALKINTKIGRLEGMASNYGNLGLIYQTRDEFDQAEDMTRQALEINKKIGRLAGMAIQYGNLGVIYERWGELDQAEEMTRKGLEISEKIGSFQAIASQYTSLGLICQARGELDQAEDMLTKALEINEETGYREGMAIVYGNLGFLYQKRGELDRAEDMLDQALEINQRLGSLVGMANDYSSLGLLYQTRGEFDHARSFWEHSLELFRRLGATPKIQLLESRLSRLDAE